MYLRTFRLLFNPVATERPSRVLGCEESFESLLVVVKKYTSDLWEVRKAKLYADPGSTQPQSQSPAGSPRGSMVVEGKGDLVRLVSSVTHLIKR